MLPNEKFPIVDWVSGSVRWIIIKDSDPRNAGRRKRYPDRLLAQCNIKRFIRFR